MFLRFFFQKYFLCSHGKNPFGNTKPVWKCVFPRETPPSASSDRKLHYLVKWEGFSVEHNSWEPWDNVLAPELVADFYQRHPGAAHHIHMVDFNSIPFHSVSGCHCLEGGWMLGDTPLHPMFPPIFLHHLCIFLLIVASPRRSALVALILESNGHVT